MISRQEANNIAESIIKKHQLGKGVNKVLTLEEITFALPNLYGVDLADCWIAYVNPEESAGLSSSQIVVIKQDTGLVTYYGSAHDEG